jgi:dTDP-4-amino-4,6-dideoxygalactose transaminase
MKKFLEDIALFGGARLFTSHKPIGQLDCPPVETYLALLRKAFDARWLSNGGALSRELEIRLAKYHNVAHCVAVANAACGLIMLMRSLGRKPGGEVVMPAFSYRGLPHFARWAGHMPRFCEVNAATHTLEPESVARAIGPDTALILAVGNFNSVGDVEGLCSVAADADVPIIFDSVYAMASTYRGTPVGRFGAAEVFSLHATKLLNGFEGGYVTTNDDRVADLMRWQRNFALPGLRPEAAKGSLPILGINAKLNELHAGMALASLDRIEQIIAGDRARFEAYQEEFRGLRGLTLVPYPDASVEKSNYQMAVAEVGPQWPLTRDQTVQLLRAEGAQISGYYSPALHQSEHCPAGLKVEPLPVTESLATRFFQLPVGELVSIADIHSLGDLLCFVAEHGEGIRERMEALPA